jgi:hypothetical protein
LIGQVLREKPVCIPTSLSAFLGKAFVTSNNRALGDFSKHRGGQGQAAHHNCATLNDSGIRPAIVKCTAKAPNGCASNYSFKPRPLRGLVHALSCNTSLGRCASRLNSGVRCHKMKRGNLIVTAIGALFVSTILIALALYKTFPIPGATSILIANPLCAVLIGWVLGNRYHSSGTQAFLVAALVVGSALAFLVSFLTVRPSISQALLFFSLPTVGIASAFLASKNRTGGT